MGLTKENWERRQIEARATHEGWAWMIAFIVNADAGVIVGENRKIYVTRVSPSMTTNPKRNVLGALGAIVGIGR